MIPTTRAMEKARAFIVAQRAYPTFVATYSAKDLEALLDEARAEGVLEGLERAALECERGRVEERALVLDQVIEVIDHQLAKAHLYAAADTWRDALLKVKFRIRSLGKAD
jgi:hypothetical protein